MNGPDMTLLTIRRATPADAAVLAPFAARCFEQAFGAQNDPKDLAAHLAKSFGVARLTEELQDPGYVTLLALTADEEPAGYAQLRRQPPPACVTTARPAELRRFYVDGRWHGSGIAGQLMQAALAAAHETLGAASLWLSVWTENPRAVAFYAKHGFAIAGSADFWVGADRQSDHIMVRSALVSLPA
jgi:ribosomal protein S18 acetylase RimI-like enzyme